MVHIRYIIAHNGRCMIHCDRSVALKVRAFHPLAGLAVFANIATYSKGMGVPIVVTTLVASQTIGTQS